MRQRTICAADLCTSRRRNAWWRNASWRTAWWQGRPAPVLICVAVVSGAFLSAAAAPSAGGGESAAAPSVAAAAVPAAQLTEVLPGLWVGGAVPVERIPGWPISAPVSEPTAALAGPDAAHPPDTAQAPRRIFAVIDLRSASEGPGLADMRAAAKAAGVGFVSVPVGRIGPPPDAAVEQLAAVLRNAEGAPVVLQCTSGNRAGDVLARFLIRTGVDVDSAIARGRSVGLSADRAAAIRSAALGHP